MTALALREKCPYSELFWSAFFRIRTEYGEILRIKPENADQNKCGYGHVLRSVVDFRFSLVNAFYCSSLQMNFWFVLVSLHSGTVIDEKFGITWWLQFTTPRKEVTWDKLVGIGILTFMAAILFLSSSNISFWDIMSTENVIFDALNTHVFLFTLRPFYLMHFKNIFM